jgi:hypothetical protein
MKITLKVRSKEPASPVLVEPPKRSQRKRKARSIAADEDAEVPTHKAVHTWGELTHCIVAHNRAFQFC